MQLAGAAALSPRATTRPVNRWGFSTELTTAGEDLLQRARPLHDQVLRQSLETAARTSELASLATALLSSPSAS